MPGPPRGFRKLPTPESMQCSLSLLQLGDAEVHEPDVPAAHCTGQDDHVSPRPPAAVPLAAHSTLTFSQLRDSITGLPFAALEYAEWFLKIKHIKH